MYAIDCETTHLGEHEVAECIQIAIVKLGLSAAVKDTVTPVYNRKFKPRNTVHISATRVHGMTNGSLAQEPQFERADALAILGVLEGCKVVVGHNLSFDMQRLRDTFLLSGARDLLPRLARLR